IPLILNGVPGTQSAWPRHALRVHPRATGDLVAETLWRAAQPSQERRARAAVKVDGEIESLGSKASAQGEVGGQSPQSAKARCDDDFADVGVADDDRRRVRFDDVGEVSVRVVPPQSVNRRRREDHIADLAQTNQKDS